MRGLVVAAGVAAVLLCTGAARAAVLVTIDKTTQRMTVSVDGERRHTWPVSTGRAGYGTPSGSYKPFRLEKDHFSKEWDDAPMPNSIFFTPKGHAIHGSFETRRLGTPASHGCVRLAPANAATLFALVKSHGLGNTRIVLSGEAPRMIARPRQGEQPYAAAQPGYQQPYGTQPQYPVQSQYPAQYPGQYPATAQPRYQPGYAQPFGLLQPQPQPQYAAPPSTTYYRQ